MNIADHRCQVFIGIGLTSLGHHLTKSVAIPWICEVKAFASINGWRRVTARWMNMIKSEAVVCQIIEPVARGSASIEHAY